MPLVNGTGNSPSPGRPIPRVVKQDKSSGGSVDTTKTRSGPQRVGMSSGERPIGAAKGILRPCAKPPHTNKKWAANGVYPCTNGHTVTLVRCEAPPAEALKAPMWVPGPLRGRGGGGQSLHQPTLHSVYPVNGLGSHFGGRWPQSFAARTASANQPTHGP